MKYGSGNVKFWGRMWLSYMGATALAAAFLTAFYGIGTLAGTERGIKEILLLGLSMFPYYLVVSGAFVLWMVIITCFQTYLSVLISMNVIRRKAVAGILALTLGLTLGTLTAAAVFWLCIPGELSGLGLRMMPYITGFLLLWSALGTVLGIVVARWGKIGLFLVAAAMAIAGGVCGFSVAVSGSDAVRLLEGIRISLLPLLAAGAAAFLAAAAMGILTSEKMEVRI